MGTQIGSFFSFVLDIVIYDIFTTELESSMDLALVLAVWVDKLRLESRQQVHVLAMSSLASP